MNTFQKQISDASGEFNAATQRMIGFSHRLQVAMKLNQNDLQSARRHEITFSTLRFLIQVSMRHVAGEWRELLIALPKTSGHPDKVGYSNIQINIPETWDYYPKGTCTVVAPPLDVQEEILQEVEAAM